MPAVLCDARPARNRKRPARFGDGVDASTTNGAHRTQCSNVKGPTVAVVAQQVPLTPGCSLVASSVAPSVASLGAAATEVDSEAAPTAAPVDDIAADPEAAYLPSLVEDIAADPEAAHLPSLVEDIAADPEAAYLPALVDGVAAEPEAAHAVAPVDDVASAVAPVDDVAVNPEVAYLTASVDGAAGLAAIRRLVVRIASCFANEPVLVRLGDADARPSVWLPNDMRVARELWDDPGAMAPSIREVVKTKGSLKQFIDDESWDDPGGMVPSIREVDGTEVLLRRFIDEFEGAMWAVRRAPPRPLESIESDRLMMVFPKVLGAALAVYHENGADDQERLAAAWGRDPGSGDFAADGATVHNLSQRLVADIESLWPCE